VGQQCSFEALFIEKSTALPLRKTRSYASSEKTKTLPYFSARQAKRVVLLVKKEIHERFPF